MLRRVRESERLWFDLERLVAQHSLPDRTINALFDAASNLRVRKLVFSRQEVWPEDASILEALILGRYDSR